MSDAQRRSYDTLRSAWCIPFPPDPPGMVPEPADIFGNGNPLTVEIGFGMGIATAIIAEGNPGKNYLGFEVYRPGIGSLLREIEKRNLRNIRIVEYDAVAGMELLLPDRSVDAFHIFFPDPWPKKRHHKRRLVTRPFTGTLARKLKSGAYLYMVTDWEDYAFWALRELSATGGLRNPYDGFAPPRDWRPETKFERKGLAQSYRVRELYFEAHHG
ncbi:MAG: tRNA (guanosine(46)-N7)-methyltransferase TrmB [Spirochaetaceae bacterium]|jgi:tRNA (guanine-N7-)-methyltransferase|nr:tRNA (guanosine(46)-N7)-methyltransferase TrmB [Spirochaetaceae bacterium]